MDEDKEKIARMGDNRGITDNGIRILSSNALKIIACIIMLIDHIGIVFMENNRLMRAVGRLAFPIFAFLIVQGLFHTSDIRKYIMRLGLFAVLSEIPFDLAMHDILWYPGAQNIFFTLAVGLFAIYAMESRGPIGRWKVEIALAAALLAEFLRFDYGMAGVGVIILFYLCEKERSGVPAGCGGDAVVERPEGDSQTGSYFGWKQNLEIVLVSALMYVLCLGMNQMYALLAVIPVNMYSGKRGKLKLKYFFYLFYPVHLLLLWLICKM